MAKQFNSNNFAFRPTTMADAMERAGLNGTIAMVREPKQSITATKTNEQTGETTWQKERMLPIRRAA